MTVFIAEKAREFCGVFDSQASAKRWCDEDVNRWRSMSEEFSPGLEFFPDEYVITEHEVASNG